MSANQQNMHNQAFANQAASGYPSAPAQTIESPRVGTVRSLEMDADVKRVMEFMQSNMSASKLVNVAQAVAAVAQVMWGHYERDEVRALSLQAPSINACIRQQQSAASESA